MPGDRRNCDCDDAIKALQVLARTVACCCQEDHGHGRAAATFVALDGQS